MDYSVDRCSIITKEEWETQVASFGKSQGTIKDGLNKIIKGEKNGK